jgi:uncharacterized membrane protein YraQ (UPF0718 family)
MGNTAICSYIVDAYPLQSMTVIMFYSIALSLSSFLDPFFIAQWVATMGYTWTFATHGMIIVFFVLPVLVLVHRFGSRVRAVCGAPDWVDPEYDHDAV